MGEYQLTIQGYEEAKASIKENLFGIGKSFVIIGWQLTRIEASGRFREDGYSSIAEFAKSEYNMSADNVSKFKKVYETFSVPGDRPEIQDKYKNFEFSKLVDMRQLPEEDRSHLHPETYREDIRDLKEYNKEQENNLSRLLNWQQEQTALGQILKDTIREYFRSKKKTLNTLYASDAYVSESTKEMADIVYKDKSTFKTDNAFLMFHKYPTPLFVKIGQNEAEDLSWEDFLRTMREIFDPLAAGAHTYEAVFEAESQESTHKEESPSDLEESKSQLDSNLVETLDENVEKSQETAPKSGLLHEKRFPNCIYKHDEECISQECQGCSMEKAWKKEKKEERQKGKESYPHYDSNEVFDPATARMVRCFLDCGYTSLLPGGTKRFRAMGAEFAAVYRPGRADFVFYDQFGRTLCYISKERMETEYQNFTAPTEEFAPAQQKNETLPNIGRCAYDSRKTCTLAEEYKHIPGNGENCNVKCCWNCSKRGECKLECDASVYRPEAADDSDQIPGQDNIMNHPEYMPTEQNISSWSEWKPEEAVKELCTRYPELLKEMLQICRTHEKTADRAKEIQRKHAPNGYHGQACDGFSYTFEGYSRGITIQSYTQKKKCKMSYIRLALEVVNLYDPDSSEFDLAEETMEMSDSDKSVCCQQAAENTDERQHLLLEAWPDDLKDIPVPTLENVLRYLKKEEKNLEEIQIVAAEEPGFPVNVLQKAQMNVVGLRLLRNLISACLESGEKDEEGTPEQPHLPVMKNNDQRKEWLRNYKTWGLWYTDEHTGIRYYKYDFENGARLLVEEYDPEPRWTQRYNPGESYYMHLIGGPEPETNGTVPKWTFHARYNKYQNSESELIEFLKALQKGKNQS